MAELEKIKKDILDIRNAHKVTEPSKIEVEAVARLGSSLAKIYQPINGNPLAKIAQLNSYANVTKNQTVQDKDNKAARPGSVTDTPNGYVKDRWETNGEKRCSELRI